MAAHAAPWPLGWRPAAMVGAVLGLLGALGARPADARPTTAGRPLLAEPAPDAVRIDGVPKEWSGSWRELEYLVQGGTSGASDASAKVLVAYDKSHLYVAADVSDDELTANADHLELLLGIPGGKLHGMRLYPGVPGKSRGQAKTATGAPIRGAQVVEAPTDRGYSLEGKIPWSTIPGTATVRVGFRGGVFLHDADGSSRAGTVIGTAPTRAYVSLPALALASEIGLARGLMQERGLRNPPRCNLLANVVGGPMKERVLVFGPNLVVLGWDYRHGTEYYFRDIGRDPRRRDAPRCTLAELTGDGREDLVVRKSVSQGGQEVEVLEVLSYEGGGDTPTSLFAQEVRLATKQGSIDSSVSLRPAGRQGRITVKAGRARGLGPTSLERTFRTDAKPLLLPWEPVSSRTYGLRGGEFVLVDEQTRSGSAATSPPPSAPPTAGGTASSPAASSSVYDLYRHERGVRGRARFDVQANLVGDRQSERVVLHDRELCAFGPGFRGGQAYAAVTLAPFARGADVASVRTRDVTGDGRAEILVSGWMRAEAPAEAGGGEVAREVVLIYQLGSEGLRRVFAAELERRIGSNRIVGAIAYDRGTIQLRPGRAVGFTAETYPFAQEVGSSGGFEPLLLPWSGARPVRYRYDGERFRPD